MRKALSVKKVILIIIALVVVGALGYWIYKSRSLPETSEKETPQNEKATFDPLNATYTIEGELYTLVNGKSEKEIIPGAAAKSITIVWDTPVSGDINSDGINDAAMIVTNNTGGSGTFYYVVAALRNPQTDRTIGTNAILLGDRIAPENISINEDVILVNYANRRPEDSMITPPSVGVSKWIVFKNGKLVEMHICSAQEKIATVCTMDYNPVCGDNLETYSNGCVACLSNKANSWIAGECE